MHGSDGRGPNAPRHCPSCAADERRVWTAEAIIAAIQRFVRENGRLPGATEWSQTSERASYAPPSIFVQRRFGSWNAGVAAAGFTPRKVGQRGPARS
jgi:hypothetical protein